MLVSIDSCSVDLCLTCQRPASPLVLQLCPTCHSGAAAEWFPGDPQPGGAGGGAGAGGGGHNGVNGNGRGGKGGACAIGRGIVHAHCVVLMPRSLAPCDLAAARRRWRWRQPPVRWWWWRRLSWWRRPQRGRGRASPRGLCATAYAATYAAADAAADVAADAAADAAAVAWATGGR